MGKNIVQILEEKKSNGDTIYTIICNVKECKELLTYKKKKIKFSEIIQHLKRHRTTNVQDTTIKSLLKGTIRRYEHNKPPEEKIVEHQFNEEEYITLKKKILFECKQIIRCCSDIYKFVQTLDFTKKNTLNLLEKIYLTLQLIKKELIEMKQYVNLNDDNSSANSEYRLTSIQPIQDEYSTPEVDGISYKRKRSTSNLDGTDSIQSSSNVVIIGNLSENMNEPDLPCIKKAK